MSTNRLRIHNYLQVSKMERNKSNSQKWGLFQYSEFLGYYDVVVIAHNGKCADRLLSTAGTTDTDRPKLSPFFMFAYLFFVPSAS